MTTTFSASTYPNMVAALALLLMAGASTVHAQDRAEPGTTLRFRASSAQVASPVDVGEGSTMRFAASPVAGPPVKDSGSPGSTLRFAAPPSRVSAQPSDSVATHAGEHPVQSKPN